MASFKEFMSRPWLDQMSRGVAALSFATAVLVYYQQQGFMHCVADYNDAAAQVNQVRAAVVAENFAAVDQMVTDVTESTSGAATRAALERYKQTRRAADEKRAANPAPAPPSERCD